MQYVYHFVRADWRTIMKDFEANRPRAGEFAICNGRINELWNSLFTHLRNETVRARWPDTLPGTILELDPADRRVRQLVLTERGHVMRAEMIRQVHATTPALVGLDPAQRATMVELLRVLADAPTVVRSPVVRSVTKSAGQQPLPGK